MYIHIYIETSDNRLSKSNTNKKKKKDISKK